MEDSVRAGISGKSPFVSRLRANLAYRRGCHETTLLEKSCSLKETRRIAGVLFLFLTKIWWIRLLSRLVRRSIEAGMRWECNWIKRAQSVQWLSGITSSSISIHGRGKQTVKGACLHFLMESHLQCQARQQRKELLYEDFFHSHLQRLLH